LINKTQSLEKIVSKLRLSDVTLFPDKARKRNL
jgi:hypothetical protein